MCTRYSLTSAPQAVRAALATVNDELFPARSQISPTQPVHIARLDPRERRCLELVRWGLIPSWVKDPRDLGLIINVRAEVALEKPTFRAGMRYRRCLVPADGFYLWTGPKQARQATFVAPVSPGPIAFAGIWEHWLGADGSEMESMAILTVPAGPDTAHLHDRMPAILAPAQYADWLDVRGCAAGEAAAFLHPAPAGTLRAAAFTRPIALPAQDHLDDHERPEGRDP